MKIVQLHYSEPLIRRAVGHFWWRVMGWRFLAAMTLLLVSLILLVAGGDRSWWVGVAGSIFGMGLIFAGLLYGVHLRESLRKFRRIPSAEATLELGEERFRITAESGVAELPWNAVHELWQFPQVWLLLLSPAQFMTLPVADLDEEAQRLLLEQVPPQKRK